jgi:hypothetical protein
MFFQRGIQLVNIGLMVLGVMDSHGLSVDVRLQRLIRVRERGQSVGHFSSLLNLTANFRGLATEWFQGLIQPTFCRTISAVT